MGQDDGTHIAHFGCKSKLRLDEDQRLSDLGRHACLLCTSVFRYIKQMNSAIIVQIAQTLSQLVTPSVSGPSLG